MRCTERPSPARWLPLPLLALLCFTACEPDGGGEEPVDPPRQTALIDAHSFNYQATMVAAEQALAEYNDSTISWDDLGQDVHGRPLDPLLDVDDATLLLFPDLTRAEVSDGLVKDQLQQSDVGLFMICTPDDSSCRLDEFGILGSYPGIAEYFEEDQGSWLVMLGADDEVGGLAYLFLRPDAGSSATTATIEDETSALFLDVDLRSTLPVPVAADGDTELDWSGLTRDGLGNDIPLYKLDELLLGRYDVGLETIEEQFYDLEALAETLWTLEVPQIDSAHLSELTTAAGEPFEGFTGEATWLLAIRCSTCNNPMPRFVGVLDPVS
jgi:hypothetical protein